MGSQGLTWTEWTSFGASGFCPRVCPWHGDESLRCSVLEIAAPRSMPQFLDAGSRGPGRGCGLLGSPSDLGVAPGPWAPSALLVFALDTEPLVQSLGYTPSPRPPPLPHKGLLSLPWPPGGDLSPSILALHLAPGPGAIRSARPWHRPQISWIYRAPHAAPPPSLPCPPPAAPPSPPSQRPSGDQT